MSSIRPMERADLDAVARVYERVFRSGSEIPAPGLRDWFERSLFDNPWADAEIPSLVAVDGDGRVVGALCSHVRRLRIDGEPARMAVSGPMVVAPEARKRAYGALLLRSYLGGPQDLSITDGANEPVRVMWERLGGVASPLECIQWWRFLRPFGAAKALWVGRTRRPLPARVERATNLLDRASLSLVRGRLSPVETGEPLTSAGLIAELPQMLHRLRLVPDYDPQFLDWLLAELAGVVARGELRARLVRRDGRAALGYFVYYLLPGGFSPVIAVAGPDEAATAAVLDALIQDARAGGAAILYGRLEPRLLEPVARRRTLFRYSTATLVHASNTAILGLALSRHALLTRLEGHWWMAPQLGAEVHGGPRLSRAD